MKNPIFNLFFGIVKNHLFLPFYWVINDVILNLSIQIQEIKGEPAGEDEGKVVVFHYATEEAYLERLAILEERLKNAKKDLKINNKELSPLEKVNRTLERDK